MDLKDRRERINQLIKDLATSTAPEAAWMRELHGLQLDDAKDRMVDAEVQDIPRIQGEARFLEKLHKQTMAASALLRANREQ